FRLLWSTLNGKLKQLKKSGTIVKHHDNLTDEEIQKIFQHDSISIDSPQGLQYRIFIWCCLLFQSRGGEYYLIKISQFVFTSNGGLQFTKYSQKNDQGGIESDNSGLVIPVPPDLPESQGPIHDLKLYFSKRPEDCECPYLHLRINHKFKYNSQESWYCDSRIGEKLCQSFMKNICNIIGIDTKNRSITNHSGRSTSITALFRKGVPMVTTMALTGHKSEASYRVYARPSGKEKEDALSTLINNIELPSKQDDIHTKDLSTTATCNNQAEFSEPKENSSSTASNLSNKVSSSSVKGWNSVTRPFRIPLKNLNQPLHLPPHINATKNDPTLGGLRQLYKHNYQTSEEESNGNV
ncbi:11780_t:CDS:2, partial [Scutellospora calospora]